VYLDGVPAALRNVEDTVADLYRQAPDTRLHIIADRNTPYEKINSVLEILQVLQYRVVSFVVKNDL
ncbi:MAG: biopolymer transporter ExbD, partial [Treponema sp.]|nr:biopolymer transporter ExbD [Treponema sp.]